jgi:tRNA pseudouridine13 synthase
MTSSDAEKNIGIETFLTPAEGIGGKLRTIPRDFIVREISQYPPRKEKGGFTIATVTEENWETNTLINELANRLHISRRRISFAGTKDKRAQTTRLMSFYNVPLEKLLSMNIQNLVMKDVYYSDHPVSIGDLRGNRFEVTIRDIDRKIRLYHLQDVVTCIDEHNGFPNFYGIQRFGAIRPITHVVGSHLVNDDFENAVMSYLGCPVNNEDIETRQFRKYLEETHDFPGALELCPRHLHFERALLHKLVVSPHDFVSALKQLPKNLLTMFIYAYQSYLFNKMLSQRLLRGLPLDRAVAGDIVLPIRKGSIDTTGILVREKNREKVNKQVAKGKAYVSGVLVGSESEFAEGEMGEIEHEIVDQEKIEQRDFIIPEIPFISSSGSRRSLLASVKNLMYTVRPDDLHNKRLSVVLRFELRKGSYATALLREFMKSDCVRNY